MSTTFIIIIGIVVLFIGLFAYNFKKMKNMPNVPNSAKIATLSNKNFKHQIKTGITLVDFWAPWCGPCKMMAPTLNEMAEAENNNFLIAKVNVDNEQQLAQKFKIRSIPTMVLFNNGKEVKRFSGVKSKKFLMNEVNALV